MKRWFMGALVLVLMVSFPFIAIAQEQTPPADSPPPASPPKPGNAYNPADGFENWQYLYDISGFKPGKYNLIIRVIDSAGNIAFGGPFNILIDPLSDLPIAQINNPLPFMRIGGDLNIVGTCTDDDGVKEVQIRIDDSDWITVNGKDYWSYFLKTNTMPDGLHTLFVRGIDINGLPGTVSSVMFHLDRTKPLHEINKPDFGKLVSGSFKVEGSVTDANGIKNITYSVDQGKNWNKLSFNLDKKNNSATFKLQLDSKKFPDGPGVIWFKSEDSVGSIGIAVFLVYVDNTPPEITITTPDEKMTVNGEFVIGGRAFDAVGIKSLEWIYGKETGTIELVPGNPYFVKKLDPGNASGKISITFKVTDIAGNVRNTTITRTVDVARDLPVLTITAPKSGDKLSDMLEISGFARDDDGVAKIVWQIDKNPEQEYGTDSSFIIRTSDIAFGTHTLSVWAVDKYGKRSNPAVIPFTWFGAGPVISLTGATDINGQKPFIEGIELSTIDGKAVLSGVIKAENQLAKVTYAINGGTPAALTVGKTPGEASFTLPLPPLFGVLIVEIQAVDAAGKTGVLRIPVYSTNYARLRTGPLLDFANADKQEVIEITQAKPLVGALIAPYFDEQIKSVNLEPATDVVKVTQENSLVTISFGAEGITEPTKIVLVTTKNRRIEAGPYVFRTGAQPPAFMLTKPVFGSWNKGSIEIAGVVTDGSVLAQAAISVNGGSWQPAAIKGKEFSLTVPNSGIDGPVLISVRVLSATGGEAVQYTAVMSDTTAPQIRVLAPVSGSVTADRAGGTITFVCAVDEPLWSIASIEVLRGTNIEKIAPANIVSFTANPKSGAVQLRVTDNAGNVTTVNAAENIKTALEPYMPEGKEIIKSNIVSAEGLPSLSLVGADSVGSVTWAGPFLGSEDPDFPKEQDRVIRMTGAANFTIKLTGIALNAKKPEIFYGFSKDAISTALALKAGKTAGDYEGTLKLPSQTDGRSTLWFKVLDQDGNEYTSRCELEYDSTPPQLTLVAPGTTAPGIFTLVVQADDLFGIAQLSYKIGTDAGNFELIPGSTIGVKTITFPAKTTNLEAVITAIDGSGNKAVQTYKIALDTASLIPDIRFITQFDGITLTRDMPIIVYATGNAGIRSVSVGLDASAFGSEGTGPLFTIDLGTVSPGRHTLSAVAVDSLGTNSKKLQAGFIRAGDDIGVSFNAIKHKNIPVQFIPGMPVIIADGTMLETAVASAIPIKTFEYRFNEGEWQKAVLPQKPSQDGSLIVSIPLTAKLPYGRVLVETRAEDTAGLVTSKNTVLYRVASEQAEGLDDNEKVYLVDGRFTPESTMLVKPGDTVRAYFNGRPISTAVLAPNVPYLSVSFEGSIITISATSEGIAAATKLVVTTVDNEKYETELFIIVSDADVPQVQLNDSSAVRWVNDQVQITGTVHDVNGIKLLEYSLDNGATWTPSPFNAADTKGANGIPVSLTIPLSGLADGGYQVFIRATDNAGRTSTAVLPIAKDTQAPAVTTVLPKFDEEVNGFILHILEVSDAGDIATVEYSIDGKNWEIIDPEKWYPRGSLDPLPTGKDAVLPPFSAYVTIERMLDLGLLTAGPELLAYRVKDKAGNQTVYYPLAKDSPSFIVNINADKPVAQISIPAEMEVMRSDFVISGIAFDDDGVAGIAWRIDGGEWQHIDNSNSFSVPFKLLEIADNEHTFEVYAVDINGVQGLIAKRIFRVSQAEPVGELVEPFNETIRGVVQLKGTASDANDIKEVWVSFDNGNTYNKAQGTTSWSYTLDTRILKDGVHSLYIRIVDNYETPGFAAGLLSIDNTAPVVNLDTPFDGSELFESFILGGRVTDNIALKSLVMEITPIGSALQGIKADLPLNTVFSKAVDISKLTPGWYNLRVTATDFANNESYVARNFMVLSGQKAETIDIIFPVHGEKVSGSFSISGKVTSIKQYKRAVVYLNNEPYATVDINKDGYFNLPMNQEELVDGAMSIRVETSAEEGSIIKSETRTILYEQYGPWLAIDSVITGDFITGRPYVTGTCGWNMPVADKADKQAWALYQQQLKERTPVKVEYSFDNGRSFMEAKGVQAFKFRLETQEYVNGELRILVRAIFANGEYAVRKVNVTIDTKKPSVTVIAPEENGRFNQSISVVGTAFDENGLKEVGVLIRTGDKSAYSVPGFIQGSYFDAHVLGATRYETGLGLSFFDDNVKLQFALGQGFDARPTWDNIFGVLTEDTPPADVSRFGGYVMGLKLLANIAYLPFGYYFGPDWDFFSMSFTMGANFTYFSMQKDIANILVPPEGRYIILSSILGQWEFAKVTFKDWSVLKSYALYVEGSLIFIPSEASTSLEELVRPNIALGLRIGLF